MLKDRQSYFPADVLKESHALNRNKGVVPRIGVETDGIVRDGAQPPQLVVKVAMLAHELIEITVVANRQHFRENERPITINGLFSASQELVLVAFDVDLHYADAAVELEIVEHVDRYGFILGRLLR